jgi:hypothetical protein
MRPATDRFGRTQRALTRLPEYKELIPKAGLMDPIETLISERPHFHTDGAGRSANWSVVPDVLRFVRSNLKPSMRTLETGAGRTTVAFAIAETHHVCITPQRTETEQICSYCREHGIEGSITFIHESSDIALASGQGIPDVLDFVFIDGAHQFPLPILDWYFTERKVPVGGIMAVDDYLTPSVRILHDFLVGEDEWELLQSFRSLSPINWGTSFFRRKREPPVKQEYWHMYQNMNKPRRHPLRFLLHHPRYTLRGFATRVLR